MKKILLVVMSLLLVLSLCACGTSYGEPEQLERTYVLSGKVTSVSKDTLTVYVYGEKDTEKWGETIHVFSDKASEFCKNDMVNITFSSVAYPQDKSKPVKIFADIISSAVASYKPIIYLYPQEPTVCSVRLELDGELTCTYPEYDNGWDDFTAYPDGTLIFPDGKEYYALYWEGLQNAEWDFSQGFCVRGADTAAFLEWALLQQGLTPREANEFIVYWLPLMQDNPYNVISFQHEAYTGSAVLDISPAPQSVLRVFMAYYPSDTSVDIAPQAFDALERNGFTVVEWGGSRVSK